MIKKIFLLLILLLTVVAFFSYTSEVNAWSPDIYGHVKTQTGAPIPGIWVKWTDALGNVRYTQSDNSGYFLFPNRSIYSKEQMLTMYNTMIDTNLDGTNDSRLVSTSSQYGFGCWENPQVFTAVKPYNVAGYFSQPTKFIDQQPLVVNNAEAIKELVDIVYYSPTASCVCNNISYTGNLSPGSTINIKVGANITGDFQLGSTVFHVIKDGYELASSDKRPFSDAGAGNYTSTWSYQLPQELGEYAIYADFSCDVQNFNEFLGVYKGYLNMTPFPPEKRETLKLGTFTTGLDNAKYKLGCNWTKIIL